MTQTQALQEALYLALSAADEMRAAKAVNLAIQFASGLSIDQVEEAKALALELYTGEA
jgi:hypothetical protein